MITIDPIEMGRMTDPAYEAEDERQRALEELERLANPALANLTVPAPPGSERRITGGTAYPPGTHPPPDPITARRGAEDIYGDEGRGGPPAPMRSMQPQGAGRGLAAPPQEPVRGPTPRPELLAAMQRQGVGRSPDLGGRGAGQYLANPVPQPPPAPVEPMQPPAEETTRAKLGRLLASRSAAPERDYTGVDVADAVASPFRGLARGLMAAGGMGSARGETWGEQARARDRAADADAARAAAAESEAAGEAQDRALAERRVGTQERAQEALAERQQSLSETGQAREERTAQIAARALELRETGMESGAALTQARIEAIRSAQAEREALRDPTSPESLRAVDRFGRRVEHIGQVTGRDYDINAEGLAAEDVRAMEQGLSSTRSPQAPRGRGAGSGGGPMDRPPWFAGDDAEWSALGATGRRSAILRHSQNSGGAAGGGMTEADARTQGTIERLGRAMDETQRWATDTQRARELVRGASDAELRAAFMGGPAAAIAPERVQAIRSAVTTVQGALLLERSGATVSEEEFTRTREELGAMPTRSPQLFRDWIERAAEMAQGQQRRIRARFPAETVQEYESRLTREGVDAPARPNAPPSGAAAPAGGPQSDMVRVRRPDGSERSVPRRLAERARARGWEVIDGP